MTEADLADLSPNARAAALGRFRALRSQGLFTPPSRAGSIVLPGFDGGGEWGGAAVDPETGVLYVNASDVPWIAAMRESARLPPPGSPPRTGGDVYAAACASCHGTDRRGSDRVTSLIGIGARLSTQQIHEVLERGRGFMPSFANLPEAEKEAVLAYLVGGRKARSVPRADRPPRWRPPRTTAPYEFVGYERWRDSSGLPAIRPPWGTLTAIDLNTGEHRWRIPLGQHPEVSVAPGTAATGTEQYGGPIVTAGGLVFIAATLDAKFRAFDKATGRLLWETTLPAAGYATPATFSVGGAQYVVIAAGGGKLGTASGDAYVAFALPPR
jgi:quinoprotein glucose dehydrogenase